MYPIMVKIKKISEVLGKSAFTDAGDHLGVIEEANLLENKIDGWKIRLSSHISDMLNGVRGIIVPHQFVKSIGDVFIISKTALPLREGHVNEEIMAEESLEPTI